MNTSINALHFFVMFLSFWNFLSRDSRSYFLAQQFRILGNKKFPKILFFSNSNWNKGRDFFILFITYFLKKNNPYVRFKPATLILSNSFPDQLGKIIGGRLQTKMERQAVSIYCSRATNRTQKNGLFNDYGNSNQKDPVPLTVALARLSPRLQPTISLRER